MAPLHLCSRSVFPLFLGGKRNSKMPFASLHSLRTFTPAQVTFRATVSQRCDGCWLQAGRGDRSSGAAAGQAAHTAAGQATETSRPSSGHGRRGAGANPRQTDKSGFSGRKLLRAARPMPVFRGARAPKSGDGPAATRRAKRGSAPRAPLGHGQGQGRCRADPPPARLSVWARGEGRGAPPPGRENDPRLPARPPGAAERGAALTCEGAGAGWAAAAASLGWGPRCGHRSPAGQRRGEPGPGSWQRRGPYGAAPAAGGAGGRAALGHAGGREGGTEKGGRG